MNSQASEASQKTVANCILNLSLYSIKYQSGIGDPNSKFLNAITTESLSQRDRLGAGLGWGLDWVRGWASL